MWCDGIPGDLSLFDLATDALVQASQPVQEKSWGIGWFSSAEKPHPVPTPTFPNFDDNVVSSYTSAVERIFLLVKSLRAVDEAPAAAHSVATVSATIPRPFFSPPASFDFLSSPALIRTLMAAPPNISDMDVLNSLMEDPDALLPALQSLHDDAEAAVRSVLVERSVILARTMPLYADVDIAASSARTSANGLQRGLRHLAVAHVARPAASAALQRRLDSVSSTAQLIQTVITAQAALRDADRLLADALAPRGRAPRDALALADGVAAPLEMLAIVGDFINGPLRRLAVASALVAHHEELRGLAVAALDTALTGALAAAVGGGAAAASALAAVPTLIATRFAAGAIGVVDILAVVESALLGRLRAAVASAVNSAVAVAVADGGADEPAPVAVAVAAQAPEESAYGGAAATLSSLWGVVRDGAHLAGQEVYDGLRGDTRTQVPPPQQQPHPPQPPQTAVGRRKGVLVGQLQGMPARLFAFVFTQAADAALDVLTRGDTLLKAVDAALAPLAGVADPACPPALLDRRIGELALGVANAAAPRLQQLLDVRTIVHASGCLQELRVVAHCVTTVVDRFAAAAGPVGPPATGAAGARHTLRAVASALVCALHEHIIGWLERSSTRTAASTSAAVAAVFAPIASGPYAAPQVGQDGGAVGAAVSSGAVLSDGLRAAVATFTDADEAAIAWAQAAYVRLPQLSTVSGGVEGADDLPASGPLDDDAIADPWVTTPPPRAAVLPPLPCCGVATCAVTDGPHGGSLLPFTEVAASEMSLLGDGAGPPLTPLGPHATSLARVAEAFASVRSHIVPSYLHPVVLAYAAADRFVVSFPGLARDAATRVVAATKHVIAALREHVAVAAHAHVAAAAEAAAAVTTMRVILSRLAVRWARIVARGGAASARDSAGVASTLTKGADACATSCGLLIGDLTSYIASRRLGPESPVAIQPSEWEARGARAALEVCKDLVRVLRGTRAVLHPTQAVAVAACTCERVYFPHLRSVLQLVNVAASATAAAVSRDLVTFRATLAKIHIAWHPASGAVTDIAAELMPSHLAALLPHAALPALAAPSAVAREFALSPTTPGVPEDGADAARTPADPIAPSADPLHIPAAAGDHGLPPVPATEPAAELPTPVTAGMDGGTAVSRVSNVFAAAAGAPAAPAATPLATVDETFD